MQFRIWGWWSQWNIWSNGLNSQTRLYFTITCKPNTQYSISLGWLAQERRQEEANPSISIATGWVKSTLLFVLYRCWSTCSQGMLRLRGSCPNRRWQNQSDDDLSSLLACIIHYTTTCKYQDKTHVSTTIQDKVCMYTMYPLHVEYQLQWMLPIVTCRHLRHSRWILCHMSLGSLSCPRPEKMSLCWGHGSFLTKVNRKISMSLNLNASNSGFENAWSSLWCRGVRYSTEMYRLHVTVS